MKDFKFDKLEYVRPDMENFKNNLSELTNQLKNAASYEEAKEAFLTKDKYDQELSTMYTIAFIRNTLDTTNEFYEAEVAYFNEVMPTVQSAFVAFGEALSESSFRKDFENGQDGRI